MSDGIATIQYQADDYEFSLTNNQFVYNQQGVYLPVTYSATKWGKWQSAIFMPKSIARIWLEITEVRAEKLQEITRAECAIEGIDTTFALNAYPLNYQQVAFKNLWDSLNAKRGYSWESNPWVWVLGFKLLGISPSAKKENE